MLAFEQQTSKLEKKGLSAFPNPYICGGGVHLKVYP